MLLGVQGFGGKTFERARWRVFGKSACTGRGPFGTVPFPGEDEPRAALPWKLPSGPIRDCSVCPCRPDPTTPGVSSRTWPSTAPGLPPSPATTALAAPREPCTCARRRARVCRCQCVCTRVVRSVCTCVCIKHALPVCTCVHRRDLNPRHVDACTSAVRVHGCAHVGQGRSGDVRQNSCRCPRPGVHGVSLLFGAAGFPGLCGSHVPGAEPPPLQVPLGHPGCGAA